MTREQAKSELMQIYGSLSEEKKRALDVLMVQVDGEYIKKSDMIDWLKDIRHKMKPQNYHTASEFEIAENQIWNLIQMLQMGAFPTVAIPSAEPCEDAISRQAVLDLLEDTNNGWIINEVSQLPSVRPQEPSRDMEEIEEIINCDADAETKCKMISNILTAKPYYFEKQEPKDDKCYYCEHNFTPYKGNTGEFIEHEPKTRQFAKWVASEIFDEMWEYNKDAFAEIACRKLEKLGIVRAKGDEWKLVESKESDHKCHTCKHYTSGEHDGSCGSYICKGYSDWESEE